MCERLLLEVERRSGSAHSAIFSLAVLYFPIVRIMEFIERAAPLIRPRRVLQVVVIPCLSSVYRKYTSEWVITPRAQPEGLSPIHECVSYIHWIGML